MLNFNWSEEAGGHETLDLRIDRQQDGTIKVQNLKESSQTREYRNPDECVADFAELMGKDA